MRGRVLTRYRLSAMPELLITFIHLADSGIMKAVNTPLRDRKSKIQDRYFQRIQDGFR
jgi:hypothetical protein